MRRVAPWFLLSVLLAGVGVGAALGLARGSATPSSSQWVADVLAATEKAASAHFSYSNVTSSPDRELRGSLSGHGEVDFITDDVRVSEVDHDISFTATGNQPLHPVSSTNTTDAIVIGGTLYQAIPIPIPGPIPGHTSTERYQALPFPSLPRARRGLSLALNAPVALDTLRGPNAVASVTDLGPEKVDGIATTRYEVAYAPLHVCAPHQAPQVLTQRPSRVWVDGAGRLVRVQSTLYFSDRLPRGVKLPAALKDLPRGPTTTVATLTFSRYGASVHVAAPPKSALLPQAGISTSFGIAVSDTCGRRA